MSLRDSGEKGEQKILWHRSPTEAADFLMYTDMNTTRDNLRGQCTKGHSCKISNMERLQRTIDILEEQVDGVGFERDES